VGVLEQERFGKYEILRKLGSGMADVYLARDPVLNRLVVLKTIEKSDDEARCLAIEAEKRGTAIQRQFCGNDRILQIFESGERDGCFFVVMEYFPGRTLAEILKAERRLDAKRAARYASEICSQLRFLHEFTSEDGRKTPVVHGDIKPSNVQVGGDDRLRLLDFGIAKVISSGRDLTRHQLGSPSYCSPERLRDSQVDVHADIWATGVSLYEMIAGSTPFQAETTRQLERLIQSGKSPGALPDDCPASLKLILAKALAPDLGRRYPSAEAFEADLRAFVGQPCLSSKASPALPPRAKATIVREPLRPDPSPPPVPAPPAHRVRRARIRIKWPLRDLWNTSLALLAGVLTGLAFFLPITTYLHSREISRALTERKDYIALPASELAADWQDYQTIKHGSSWWTRVFPPAEAEDRFRANLLESANNAIGRFRWSSDDRLENFDWARSRLCLLYALEIDSTSKRARGQLHLCDGYLTLEHPGHSQALLGIRSFQRAEALLPQSPDPHLALARAYLAIPNIGAALAEFHQAEQLGYDLGPREMEEEADGYLERGEAELNRAKDMPPENHQEAAKWLRLARGDMDRARSLYEPIAGFGHVNTNLERMDSDEGEEGQLETTLLVQPPPKPHLVLLKLRFLRSRAGSYRWR
jgi:serine/threonine protein kinase